MVRKAREHMMDSLDFKKTVGEVLEEYGFVYEKRGLPPHTEKAGYHKYKVVGEFDIIEGEAAPWFEQPGGGKQLYGLTPEGRKFTVNELIEKGYLVEIR